MVRARLLQRLTLRGVTVAAVFLPVMAFASSADSLHWAAWDSSLAWSAETRAIRFSFYAYRTWAVSHPEVYLQADRLFSDVVENLPGSRLAYRTRDVRDLDLYLRLARRELKGAPFTWGSWTYIPDSVSDPVVAADARAASWLDQRLPSAAVLLRTVSARLTTAEAAAMNYTQRRRQGRACDSLFVVIDGAGRGYLAEDSVLLSAGITPLSTGERQSVQPAAVFNERSVYYPLFGRDDRVGDPALARLLTRLGPPAAMDFSSSELSRLSQLQRVTALPDSASKRLAVLIASGLVDIADPQVRAAWARCLGTDDSASLVCAAGLVPEAVFWADRLSAWAAQLAVVALADSLPRALPIVQDEYLAACGRRVDPTDTGSAQVEAWGVLWSYGLLESVLDDIVRTKAGSGLSQGMAMSAVLDLADLSHFGLLVQGGEHEVPDQDWLLADHGRFQFNFGVWRRLPVPSTAVRRVGVVATGYTKPGCWVRFFDGGYCADLDPLTVTGDLIRIGAIMPAAALVFQLRPGLTVSNVQLATDLTDGHLKASAMPWPPGK